MYTIYIYIVLSVSPNPFNCYNCALMVVVMMYGFLFIQCEVTPFGGCCSQSSANRCLVASANAVRLGHKQFAVGARAQLVDLVRVHMADGAARRWRLGCLEVGHHDAGGVQTNLLWLRLDVR